MSRGNYSLLTRFETTDFDDYRNQILVNLNRPRSNITTQRLILVFNRFNKSSVFYYYPLRKENLNKREDCNGCDVPTFVRDMNQSLFSQIRGVVPFDEPQSDDRYLILFNISNVLKYCFTEETEVWYNFDFDFIFKNLTFSAIKRTNSRHYIPNASSLR